MTKCKILFLAANPEDTESLRLDEEIRAIQKKIRMADFRDSLEFVVRGAARRDDLLEALNEVRPNVVHFSGHGSKAGEIYLEDDQKTANPISKEVLADLFRVANDHKNIKLVILNACYSKKQAEEIVKSVDFAVGMSRDVPDEAARVFAASFYSALGYGKSIQNAFEQGKHTIRAPEDPRLRSASVDASRGVSFGASKRKELSQPAIPQLLVRDGCDPKAIRLVAPSLGWKELFVPFAFAIPIVLLVFSLVWPILLNWLLITAIALVPIVVFEIAKGLRIRSGICKRWQLYAVVVVATLLAMLRFISLPRDLTGQIKIDGIPANSGSVKLIQEGKQSEPCEIKENGKFVLRVPGWTSNNERIKLRIDVREPKIANEEHLEVSISQLNNIQLRSTLPKSVLNFKQFAQEIRVQLHEGDIQDFTGRELRLKLELQENSNPNFASISEWGKVDDKSYKIQVDFLSTADRLANLKRGSEVRIKGTVVKQVPFGENQVRFDLNDCVVLDE
jgi:hypothetical protein